MPRFFADCPLHLDQVLSLPADTARHVQVLRLQPGEELTLFNGLGGSYTAQVLHMGRQSVEVSVTQHDPQERESPCQTQIVMGMPTNERMDWLVEKATELGVARITPVMSQHTVLRLSGERGQKRQAHWQGIAQAACAQSGRNRVPLIDAPVALGEWLKHLTPDTSRLQVLLSLQSDAKPWRELWGQTLPTQLLLLSGPEGGLSPEEEAQARDRGFQAVQLGERVLRSETAPLAVLAQLL